MKVASLYSGGKDSNYSLYLAQQSGWDVTNLINIVPQRPDSYMYHFPNAGLAKMQAECIGLPLIQKNVVGVKEEELNVLEEAIQESIKKYKIEGVVSGAVTSEYQRTRIDRICDRLGVKSFAPLWHKEPEMVLEEEIKSGFEIVVVGVYAYGFDESWLGRKIDMAAFKELKSLSKKYGISVLGEGGEMETFVVDGPIFRKRIDILEIDKRWEKDSGYCVIRKAESKDK